MELTKCFHSHEQDQKNIQNWIRCLGVNFLGAVWSFVKMIWKMRCHDFLFFDGEGEGEQDPGSWEEIELKFVACDVTLDTESLDNWRDMEE